MTSLETIWKKMGMTYFKTLQQHFLGRIAEKALARIVKLQTIVQIWDVPNTR
jgi:hypothetical protein